MLTRSKYVEKSRKTLQLYTTSDILTTNDSQDVNLKKSTNRR